VSENAALVKYYADLSIIQYADKPKARAFMENLLGALICYDLAVSVRDGFNLETAIGVQLDIIAKYVGVSRVITGTSFARSYFGFAEYGDTTPFDFYGFTEYGDAPEDVQYRNYKESSQSIYSLNDTELRIIIKLAILRNNSNASVKDIDTLLDALFGSEVYYIDRMNMTVVSYMLSTAYQRIFNIAKSSGLLPNPAAVGTSLIVVPDISKIFSFSLYGGAKPSFAVGYVDYFPKWSIKGNAYIIHGLLKPALTALFSSRIVLADPIVNTIQAYDFYGINLIPSGNALSIPDLNLCSLTNLSSTRIALANSGSNTVGIFDFDGEDWIQVGNSLSIPSMGNSSIVGLSSSRIALWDQGSNKLRTYDFDGTNFALIGNPLSTSGYILSMAMLSASRIALYNFNDGSIQACDFDGTNWGLIGNALVVGVLHRISIVSFSSSRISLADGDLDIIQAYDFDGTDWIAYGISLSISGLSYPTMASLSSSEIMLASEESEKIQAYDFYRDLSGCMASYS
jgi:hypothetical protein